MWEFYSINRKNKQENAMRCSNRDDLLQRFTFKISLFLEAYK